MSVHRLAPQPPLEFDLGTSEGRASLEEIITPPSDTWMRAIMVTTAAGATVDPRGTSGGLSKGDDRAILHLHRNVSDAVVLGAGTLRSERIPVPSSTPLVVLSPSGLIAAENLVFPNQSDNPVVVVTTAEGAGNARGALATVPHHILMMEPDTDAEVLSTMIRTHVSGGRLLIEGGERTWRSFIPHCDDLWLAVTPPPTSDRAGLPSWWPESKRPLDGGSVYTDEARMLYYHHRLPRGAPPKDETPRVLG